MYETLFTLKFIWHSKIVFYDVCGQEIDIAKKMHVTYKQNMNSKCLKEA